MAKSAVTELEILLSLKDTASKKLRATFHGVNKEVTTSTSKIKSLGTKLRAHWIGIAAAVAGAIAAMRGVASAVTVFANFEKGLANISVLLGENRNQIVQFEKEVEKLSVTFGIATDSLLKSAFDIQSAVGNVGKSLKILDAGTKLAVAGGSDVATTTKGLVTIMESYGHELANAADASDLLFIAQVRARATIGELSEASGSFLPLASKLGLGVEDVMAAFSKMTVVLGNVSESSTAMTGILNGMIKPTKELKAAVQEWFGMSVQQAVQQGKFLDIMERLGEVSEEEIGRMIPRIRGLKGLLAVSQDITTVREQALEYAGRAGIVETNLAVQMETTAKKLDVLGESWHELNRTAGEFIAKETPTIAFLQGMIGVINNLGDTTKETMRDIVDAAFADMDKLRADTGVPETTGGGEGVETDTGVSDVWTIRIQQAIEGTELIKQIETAALDWKKNITLADAAFLIQNEISKNDILMQLAETTQAQKEKLAVRNRSLALAQANLEKKLALQRMQQYATSTTAMLGAMATYFQTAQGESKKYASVIAGIRIAEAVINTAVAVTNALTTQPFFPVGIAMAAMAATMGAFQIATIASQGFAKGTDSVPSMLTPGEMVVPRDFASAVRSGDITIGGEGGGRNVEVNIDTANFSNDSDLDEIFTELSDMLDERRRSRI